MKSLLPAALRRPPRAMSRQAIDDVVSAVPCPNMKCGADIGQACRGENLPHTRRVQAHKRLAVI